MRPTSRTHAYCHFSAHAYASSSHRNPDLDRGSNTHSYQHSIPYSHSFSLPHPVPAAHRDANPDVDAFAGL